MGKECGKGHQWPAGICFCGGDVPPAMAAFPSRPHGVSMALVQSSGQFYDGRNSIPGDPGQGFGESWLADGISV